MVMIPPPELLGIKPPAERRHGFGGTLDGPGNLNPERLAPHCAPGRRPDHARGTSRPRGPT